MTRKRTPPEGIPGIVRDLSRLADIYWDQACFPKTFEEAARSWLDAVVQFTVEYSYAREGASPRYPGLAEKAIRDVCDPDSVPSRRLARKAWHAFVSYCEGVGILPNHKANVLSVQEGKMVPVLQFVTDLGDQECNMLLWAKESLEEGRAEEATDRLRTIRGVDWKIAAFYLRDVCDWAGLEEQRCGPEWCFQPVDRWIRRAAQAFGKRLGRQIDSYDDAADLLVELSEEAGVRGGRLNAGIWILGSELLESGEQMRDALTSREALRSHLADNLAWCRVYTGVLSAMLRPS